MRFESLLWTVLAMFLIGGAGWDGDLLVGGVSNTPESQDGVTGSPEYQAADGASEIPPPDRP